MQLLLENNLQFFNKNYNPPFFIFYVSLHFYIHSKHRSRCSSSILEVARLTTIMRMIEMGRAMTLGSTTFHGNPRRVTFPVKALQRPMAAASFLWMKISQKKLAMKPPTILVMAPALVARFQ